MNIEIPQTVDALVVDFSKAYEAIRHDQMMRVVRVDCHPSLGCRGAVHGCGLHAVDGSGNRVASLIEASIPFISNVTSRGKWLSARITSLSGGDSTCEITMFETDAAPHTNILEQSA